MTPLQLALAYAAIANGGVLMQPMLVREVRDARGNLVRRDSPQALHRVFSEATAHTLVADAAVGGRQRNRDAARAWRTFAIAGKTGTAQKYDAATGRHLWARHVHVVIRRLRARRIIPIWWA